MLIMEILKNRKFFIAFVVLILLLILSIVGYFGFNSLKSTNDNSTGINDVSQNIEGKMYTDNTNDNTYDVKFAYLDGKDVRNIKLKNSKCSIKILSKVKTGSLNLKLKKNNNIILSKTIFNKSGNADTTLNVTGVNKNGINIEVTAKKAYNGSIYLTFN